VLVLLGLEREPPALVEGMDAARVACVAFSLALTAGLTWGLGVPHPPAAATTLLVALGVVTQPSHLVALLAAVVLLVLEVLAIHRLAGVEYPAWAPVGEGDAES
jgi:hypothetical protein